MDLLATQALNYLILKEVIEKTRTAQRMREGVQRAVARHGISERRAYGLLGPHRSTLRHLLNAPKPDEALRALPCPREGGIRAMATPRRRRTRAPRASNDEDLENDSHTFRSSSTLAPLIELVILHFVCT